MIIEGFSGGVIGTPLLLPDGSAAAPSLAFSAANGTNDGIYRPSNGTLGIALEGAEYYRFTTVGLRMGANQPINDASDNELIKFGATASAVNEITVTNAATGNAPTVAATGGDTDITLKLAGKGNGGVEVGGTSGEVGFYGTTPVALQTGVAVSAAGIHAALVNLGLITA